MNDQIALVLELAIEPQKLEGFRAHVQAMVASARNEPGTLTYEFHLTDDGRTCHVYERFSNDAAAQQHAETFRRRFAARFDELVRPVRLCLYGRPDAKTLENFAAFAPLVLVPFDGLRR